MNRIIKCVALAIALLASTVYVYHAARAARSTPQGKKAGSKGAKVEGVYLQNCARCHGADGRGETPVGKLYNAPNLADAELHARFGNKELAAIITNGKAGMPAFKKKLSKAEINALVAYVRRFKK
jgi:mono/diheme cytochrome c family protein